MFNFHQFIQDNVLSHSKFKEFSPEVKIDENSIRIVSPEDKDIEMVFIQHDEFNFEAKVEVYFQHKQYGECWDMLMNIDCLPRKIESGFFCLLSENKHTYPTIESLLLDLLITPILKEKVLEHFFYLGFEFWINEKNSVQIMNFPQTAIQQYKLRKNGWIQLKGKLIEIDEKILFQIIDRLKLDDDLKIAEIQRKFSLGYNYASNLLCLAKILMREKNELENYILSANRQSP